MVHDRRLAIRPFVFPLLLAPVVMLAVLLLALCLRASPLPTGWTNARLLGGLARRLGVDYRVDSLRVGCLRPDCRADVDASGIHLGLLDAGGLQIDLDSLHWCRAHPLSVRGLRLGTGERPTLVRVAGADADLRAGTATIEDVTLSLDAATRLQIGAIEASLAGGDSVARDIRLTTASQSAIAVQQVSTSPLRHSPQTGHLTVDAIAASGVEIQFRREPAPDVCGQARNLLATGRDVAGVARASAAALERLIARLQGGLRLAAFALAGALFLLKVWTTAWTGRWPLRLASGLACTVPPIVAFALLSSWTSVATLIAATAAALAVVAVLSYAAVYRRAARRYQRWEPVAVDLACVSIVLPLAVSSAIGGRSVQAPVAFDAGRVTVAGIAASGSRDQCRGQQPFEVAIQNVEVQTLEVGLPGASPLSTRITVAAVEVPSITGDLRASTDAGSTIGRLARTRARVDAVDVEVDWASASIRDVRARVRAAGVLYSPGLVSRLQEIPTLRPLVSRLNGVDFDVDVRAASTGSGTTTTGDLDRFDGSTATVAVRGLVTLDPTQCDFAYDSSIQLVATPLQAVVTGAGDARHLDIRSIRTLPRSRLQVAGGRGTLTFADEIGATLRLLGLRASGGSATVRVASADLSASANAMCSPLRQRLTVAVNGVDITGAGSNVRIERSGLELARSGGARDTATSVSTRADGVSVAPRSTDGAPAVSGQLQSVRLALDGSTGADAIPRTFSGALNLSLFSQAGALFRNTTPVRVTADVWNGSVAIPNQAVVVQQAAVSRIPAEIPLALESRLALPLPGRAARLDGRVRVAELPIDTAPAPVVVRDLDVRAEGGTIAFSTGWNTVGSPGSPRTICLDAVPQLDLIATGSVTGMRVPEGLPLPAGALRTCAAVPLPAGIRVRLQGVWPGLRVEGSSGAGVDIRQIDPHIRSIRFVDGRLESLELVPALAGIRTLNGAGDLRASAEVRLSGGLTTAAATLFGNGDVELAGIDVRAQPGSVRLEGTQRASAELLIARLQPFLASAGISLGGVTLTGRIERAVVAVDYDRSAITSVNGLVEVQPGPLAVIELPLQNQQRSLTLSIDRGDGDRATSLEVDVKQRPGTSDASVLVTTNLNALRVSGDDARGAHLDATTRLSAVTQATLYEGGGPPGSALASSVSDVLGNLGRQASRALGMSGAAPSEGPPAGDLFWNVRLRNVAQTEPFLQAEAGHVRLASLLDPVSIAWRERGGQNSSVLASGNVTARAGLHRDQLVLDAYAPVQVVASLRGRPRVRFGGQIPLLVTFSDALQPAGDPSDGLWDADYYRRFWNSYTAAEARRADSPLLNLPRLLAGPLSVRNLAGPFEPIKMAIGYADDLQAHVPFEGRALFGSAQGRLDTNVTWRGAQALLSSLFTLSFRNIQAAAIGIDSPKGHVPIVEDELDGRIMVRSEELPVGRDTLAGLLAMACSTCPNCPACPAFAVPAGIDRLSLELSVGRSARGQATPGQLQLSGDTNVRTLNTILKHIVSDLQLNLGPRAVRYGGLHVDFRAQRGVVSTAAPWVTLDDVKIFVTPVPLDVRLRMYGARDGETVRLRDLLEAFVHDQ